MYRGTKFQGEITFTSQVTGCQVHAIETPIRRLSHICYDDCTGMVDTMGFCMYHHIVQEMCLGLRKQGMWAQATPQHGTGHISVPEHNMCIL